MKTARLALRAFLVGFGVSIGVLAARLFVVVAWDYSTYTGVFALCVWNAAEGIAVADAPIQMCMTNERL